MIKITINPSMKRMITYFFMICLLSSSFRTVGPVKMFGISTEQPFLLGKSGMISCSYDLEGSQLYSVKWYKNGKEFYRFMPGMDDHTQVFSVPGVSIDLHQSGMNSLHLATVSRDTAGIFRCEVSTEAPHFYTAVEFVSVIVMGKSFLKAV